MHLLSPHAGFGFVGNWRGQRFEDRAGVGMILEQRDPPGPGLAAEMIGQDVAADLAEPGIERRFASIAVELPDGVAEGLLHDVARHAGGSPVRR